MRNSEVINSNHSTRNRISLLKVFHSLLYWWPRSLQDIYFLYRIQLFFAELIGYACINTWKSRALIQEKLHHRQRAKVWWAWHVISVIAGKKTCLPHKTHLHTTWIIERLDRKLVDVISYNTWKNVTSHCLEPFNLLHPMFCTTLLNFSSHVSLSLSSTEDLLLEKIVRVQNR